MRTLDFLIYKRRDPQDPDAPEETAEMHGEMKSNVVKMSERLPLKENPQLDYLRKWEKEQE